MTQRFLALFRWTLRFSTLWLAFSAALGYAQAPQASQPLELAANAILIHYEPALDENITDPSVGWVQMSSGPSLEGFPVVFTSSVSANMTITFSKFTSQFEFMQLKRWIANLVELFANFLPPASPGFATADIALDGTITVSAIPNFDFPLFSFANLNSTIPHTIVVSKSQENSQDSVVAISGVL